MKKGSRGQGGQRHPPSPTAVAKAMASQEASARQGRQKAGDSIQNYGRCSKSSRSLCLATAFLFAVIFFSDNALYFFIKIGEVIFILYDPIFFILLFGLKLRLKHRDPTLVLKDRIV